MLRLDGVSKTFHLRRAPVRALRDVSLTIPEGKLTSVLGASGSGKTTLLRVIAGFESPDQGRVSLDGRYLTAPHTFVRPEQRGIGIVPQDGALFPHLDVAGNVSFGLQRGLADRLSPAKRRAQSARVSELLDLVGLAGYEKRRVDQLSGGEQQRVALARALAPSPSVILLDEPFSAIDAALRSQLGTEVRSLLSGLGITTMLVTHDQEEALSLADQVVVMRDSAVVQAGSPREVYEHPVDVDTARFVGDAVVLDATVVSCDECEASVECGLGRLVGRRRDSLTARADLLGAGVAGISADDGSATHAPCPLGAACPSGSACGAEHPDTVHSRLGPAAASPATASPAAASPAAASPAASASGMAGAAIATRATVGATPLPAGGSCHVIIRPESLRMGATGTPAIVLSSEYYGHDAVTTLRIGAHGDGPTIRVRSFEADRLPAPGTSVGIEVADPVLVVPTPA